MYPGTKTTGMIAAMHTPLLQYPNASSIPIPIPHRDDDLIPPKRMAFPIARRPGHTASPTTTMYTDLEHEAGVQEHYGGR
ncbi:hypothetical protein PVAG01_10312 [Phlyctema vagabunda]|uniref:Uncharacterized protein n=1 Tax=Phlyctema vagabunda TaxID=108571 RepID=A0ABR4P652_9HELO